MPETLEAEPMAAIAVREPSQVGQPLPLEQITTRPQITPAQAKVEAIAELTHSAYQKAATLQLTPEEVAKLQQDFPDDAFKPGAAGKDSLIYIEHAHLRDRLNQVFGPGQWAIIPRNRWAEDFRTGKGNDASRVYVEAMLLIRGAFVAEAVGDMVYYKNNESQNYGDAVEGAKTAAFRRCAKELGVGLQAWKKDFCEGWWQRRNGNGNSGHIQHPRNTPPASPPPQSKPATPALAQKSHEEWLNDCKTALLKELSGDAKGAAFGYFVDQGFIMDTEELEDARAERLFPSADKAKSRAENIALVRADHDKHMKAILPEVPGASEPEPEIPQDAEQIFGVLERISAKPGEKNGKQYTKYGVKIGGDWYNHFSDTLNADAERLKDKQVSAYYKLGKFGKDLIALRPN